MNRYCVNCGAEQCSTATICDGCGSDPEISMRSVDAYLDRLATGGLRGDPLRALRDPREHGALVGATALGAVVAVLLTGITLGLYPLLVLASLVSIHLTMARVRGRAVEVERHPDRRLRNLAHVAAARLGVLPPRVYVSQDPDLNAFTTGVAEDNIVVLTSELVRLLPPEEILFVIGHELGHLRFRHTTLMALTSPVQASPALVPAQLLGFAFRGWLLRTEYTADRAGLVAAGSLRSGMAALTRITIGTNLADEIDPRVWLERSKAETATGKVVELMGDHPFLHNRIAALIRFENAEGRLLAAQARSLSLEA